MLRALKLLGSVALSPVTSMNAASTRAELGKLRPEPALSRAPSYSEASEDNDSGPESLIDEEVDGIEDFEVGRWLPLFNREILAYTGSLSLDAIKWAIWKGPDGDREEKWVSPWRRCDNSSIVDQDSLTSTMGSWYVVYSL